MIESTDKHVITDCYMSPRPTVYDLHKARGKQMHWELIDEISDNRLTFTGKFMIRTKVKKKVFTPKGTKIANPYDGSIMGITKKDSYDQFSLYADITQLFKLKLNVTHDKAIVVPKTINADPWVKNYDLEIYLEMYADDSKPKKKKKQEHQPFYADIVNLKGKRN